MTPKTRKTLRLVAATTLLLSIVACGRRRPDDDAPPPPLASSPPSASEVSPQPPLDPSAVMTDWGRPLATPGCDARRVLGQCTVMHRGSEAELEDFCREIEGVFLPDGCPTEGRIGRCDPGELEDTTYLGHYDYDIQSFEGRMTAARARANCVEFDEGRWHPEA